MMRFLGHRPGFPAAARQVTRYFLALATVIIIGATFSCSNQQADDLLPYHVPTTADTGGAVADQASDLTPMRHPSGRPFRIGVVDSDGLWPPYVDVFAGFIEGLIEVGWMRPIELPDPLEVTLPEYLAAIIAQEYSDYVEFDLDYYIDLEWDETRADTAEFRRIVYNPTEVDVVILLGTKGGQVVAERDDIVTPIIADSISDPLRAGIIVSNTDSGRDFLTVRVDPGRYERQIRLFHDVVGFERLGVIYEDTPNGRTYAALDDVNLLAQELGFTVVANTDVLGDSAESVETAEAAFVAAVAELAPNVDAVYLTEQQGLSTDNIDAVMDILTANRVPSFAMAGAAYVARGVLFGVSESERISTGIYHARNMVALFRGVSARRIDQVFEHAPRIAINLASARAIDYDIPMSVIASSDEIYTAVER